MDATSRNAELVTQSLEYIAERVTDITPQVYAEYFRRHPEARDLFGNDPGDAIKGDMLSRLIVQIMDFAEGKSDPELIASWAADHAAYGVTIDMFPSMFDSLEQALSAAAGEAWTPEVHGAWRAQFDGLQHHISAAFRRYHQTFALAGQS